jgi:hypothetical protein
MDKVLINQISTDFKYVGNYYNLYKRRFHAYDDFGYPAILPGVFRFKTKNKLYFIMEHYSLYPNVSELIITAIQREPSWVDRALSSR